MEDASGRTDHMRHYLTTVASFLLAYVLPMVNICITDFSNL